MCGILGANFEVDFTAAAAAQHHRGPDHTGILHFGPFTLAHNRLSIIDLNESANQPFVSEDGRYAIVFNGEIYNFQSLKKELEPQHEFRTHSDTEVLLKAYITYGEACLDKLQGMFAFAIYDRQEDHLFCARDRLGVKPFVYVFKEGKMAFASEIKAILALLPQKPGLNSIALSQYLTYLYVPAPLTLFEGIYKLLPGHSLTLHRGKMTIKPYWQLREFWQHPATVSFDTQADQLRALDQCLNDAVAKRMISDVPLGAFLSGGLDSSTILYYMHQNSSHSISTFTLGFNEGRYDERKDAQIVAKYFKTNHHEILIEPNVAELLPKLVHHFDEPFGNPTALLIYELTRQTKAHVTVALAGDAGDEVFGGYPRYHGMQVAQQFEGIPGVLKSALKWGSQLLPVNTSGAHQWRRAKEFLGSLSMTPAQRYESWVGYFSEPELARMLTHPVAYPHPVRDLWEAAPAALDPVAKAAYVDLQTFLPYNLMAYGDTMSMANAFEVRFPFLDHQVVELMGQGSARDRIRNGQTKILLRKLMQDRLPPEIMAKPKLGLNPPMGIWIKTALAPLLADYLSEATLKRRGLFHPEPIRQLIADHHANRRDASVPLWGLMMLEEWMRQYEPVTK